MENINFLIVGKPNSGKSTFYNTLNSKYLSPAGPVSGLTKSIFENTIKILDINFTFFDTPGLRRKNKINDKDEAKITFEVINLIDKIDVVFLLVDSNENLTKQDLKIAEIVIKRKKILFLVFNKIDLIDDIDKFKNDKKYYFLESYSPAHTINLQFISALSIESVEQILKKVIRACKIKARKISTPKLNNFIRDLLKNQKFPKINKIEVKPKYMVQTDDDYPRFKIFINSSKKVPQSYKRFYENLLRKQFSLLGVPIQLDFIVSKNPYVKNK
ncbi:MAG: GTPase [Candidatus Puniceispirillales bacterium]